MDNYTKLCRYLTGFDEKFSRLIGSNKDLQLLIKNYEPKLMTDDSSVMKLT